MIEEDENVILEGTAAAARPPPGPQMDSIRGEGHHGIPKLQFHYDTGASGLHKEPSESGLSDISEWTVSDLGERHYIKAHPPEDRQVQQTPRKLANAFHLQDRLLKARQCIDKTKKGFFPNGMLEEIINNEAVIQSLKVSKTLSEDQIQQYAKMICYVPLKDDPTPSYRKIFAILVLLDHPERFGQFAEHHLSDRDLPLRTIPREDEEGLWYFSRKSGPDSPIKCFDGWSSAACMSFDEWQWTMLAPYFAKGKKRHVLFYPLAEEVVLPWTWKADEHRNGGFSEVFNVKIHDKHHDYHDTKLGDGTFAVKKLRFDFEERNNINEDSAIRRDYEHKKEFEAEVEILRRFSGDTHLHLVSLLAAFQQGMDYYLLFYWADADLLRFWERTSPGPPHNNKDDLKWMIQQCRGIADGLQRIHEYQLTNPTASHSERSRTHQTVDTQKPFPIYGRHGDIKPENFLIYKDKYNLNDRGVLKITDFGLAKFHSEQTRSNIRKSRIVATTPTYRPPECDMDDGKISRSFDIWSLGCVFLEFIAWHLGGWPYLKDFVRDRKAKDIHGFNSDQFFEIVKVKGKQIVAARVKLEVDQCFNRLHSHPACSEIIHHFLNLIQQEMLVVESNDRQDTKQKRASCKRVYQKLDELYKSLTDPSFQLTAAPWVLRERSIPDPVAVEVVLSQDAKKAVGLRFSELREHAGNTIRLSQSSFIFSRRRTQSGI